MSVKPDQSREAEEIGNWGSNTAVKQNWSRKDLEEATQNTKSDSARHQSFISVEDLEAEEEDRDNAQQEGKFTFDPSNKWRLRWDGLLMIFIIWNAVFVPINIAFDVKSKDSSAFGRGIDLSADGLFIIDIFVNFRTGWLYHDGNGIYKKVMNAEKIAQHYIRTQFILDVVAVGVPFGILESLDGLDPILTEIITFFGLLKMLRLAKLEKIFNRLFKIPMEYVEIFRIFKLIISFLFFNHLLACMMWFIGRKNMGSIGEECTNTTDPVLNTTVEMCIREDSWDDANGLSGAGRSEQYVTTFYWAMMTATTVGYGDISITNQTEKIYASVIMITSTIVGAIIFGNVTTLIQNLTAESQRHGERVDMVDKFIETHKLETARKQLRVMSKASRKKKESAKIKRTESIVASLEKHNELCRRMRETIKYDWDVTKFFDMGTTLAIFPTHLQTDIAMILHEDMVRNVPFFTDCGEEFVKAVVLLLDDEIALKDEYIYREGDMGDRMFFLHRGRMLVFVGPEKTARDRRASRVYGEGAFIGEICVMIDTARRAETVKTMTKCCFYGLMKTELDEIFNTFPEYKLMMCVEAYAHVDEALNKEIKLEKDAQADMPTIGEAQGLGLYDVTHSMRLALAREQLGQLKNDIEANIKMGKAALDRYKNGTAPGDNMSVQQQLSACDPNQMSPQEAHDFLRKLKTSV